ncbi:MAG: GNAT family N-acetyltransferase [Oscillospiraceae bacterium]|nr:GNAT family N-acetyltransferase [Oscillospiraceae bacterium]
MEFLETDFLEDGEIKLVLSQLDEGNPDKNWVPAYHFNICDKQNNKMGVCDLRIGYNDRLYYGGHIGYTVDKEYRGHHYAAKACKLLFSLAKRHDMEYLYITCNPDNSASRKTCEYLHGELLGIETLPADNDMRTEDGETEKCIFKFNI